MIPPAHRLLTIASICLFHLFAHPVAAKSPPHLPSMANLGQHGTVLAKPTQGKFNWNMGDKPIDLETQHIAHVQKSWILSMILPGLGQARNKDYWKIPCFYAGFFLLGYKISAEYKEMTQFQRNKLPNIHPQPNKPMDPYTDKRIGECRRTRDLFTIIAAAWYLFNILDAYASSHAQIESKVYKMDHAV